MADPVFRAQSIALHGHPFVIQRTLAGHIPHEADILPLCPVPRLVHQILVFVLLFDRMLQRNVTPFDLAKADHVGLAEQNEDLNRLGQVGRFAIGPQNRLGVFLSQCGYRRKGDHRNGCHHEQTA